MTTTMRAYEEAMQAAGVPHEPLQVYDSNSWRRVGLARRSHLVMAPMVARDGHPDITGTDVLVALVAAFNAMLELRQLHVWQPMETAPKDRNILLVREAHGDIPRTVTHGYWFEEEHGKQVGDCGGPCRCPEYEEPCEPFWISDDGGFTKEHPPVGWMDLPAPPAAAAKEPQS